MPSAGSGHHAPRAGGDDLTHLRVRLLGGFGVEVHGRPVPDAAWRLRKARTLVKLLALAPSQQLHREQLTEVLWPHLDPSAAANNFHQILYAARQALAQTLGAHRASLAYLPLRGELLALGSPVWIDAVAFQELAEVARRTQRVPDQEAAIALYGGELLPEDRYEDWVTLRRERLRELFLRVSADLADAYQREQRTGAALAALERLTDLDPAGEAAHLQLMRLYAASGQRDNALRQYRRLKDALRRELDAAPGAEAERLREDLQAGRGPPAAQAPQPAPDTPAGRAAAPSAAPGNLPLLLTSFVGRERELAEVEASLRRGRLVTLTGPGGVGKTRLALRVGERLRGGLADLDDGVWLVDLSTVSAASAADGVRRSIAQSLHLGEHADDDFRLSRALHDSRTLLILDGCEHLASACATVVVALLAGCPGLCVLATSRQPLGVAGEVLCSVPPLEVPGMGNAREEHALRGEEWTQYDGVRLFVERAQLGRPGFAVAADNAAVIGRICARLDGLPLAIELAAARVRVLSPAQIEERLEARFDLLTGGTQTAPARHQTLRATLDWSHALLSTPEAVLFRRLAVFPEHWSLEDAEVVCADPPGTAPGLTELPAGVVLDTLGRLADKSLVVVRHERLAGGRYRLLETVREYASLKLVESGELERLSARLREGTANDKRTGNGD